MKQREGDYLKKKISELENVILLMRQYETRIEELENILKQYKRKIEQGSN